MGDDTRELLSAHQAAILRELDRLHTNVNASFADMKTDMSGIRVQMDDHSREDNGRFSTIDNSLSVLKWAYGVGLVIVGAILAALRFLP